MAAEQQTPTPQAGGDDVSQNKAMGILAYIGILCLIPLFAKKDSQFAQFHAKQGLALFIGEIIISVLAVIPFLGWILYVVGMITALVLAVMGIMNAAGGKTKELPIVGSFAKKFNF